MNEDVPSHVTDFLLKRQRARTDLIWLCRNVLKYYDVSPDPHLLISKNLAKFDGGEDVLGVKHNILKYVPKTHFWDLKGSRKTLTLFPRGHLKSSIATIAHTIQWILNYPNIRIHLESATLELVYGFADEIRKHFQYNENLRFLFPEYCPTQQRAGDWGNREGFAVPNRTTYHKEPTLSVGAVGKVVAGPHYEVIICDDLIDKENVRTKDQIMTVNSHFGFLWPLLEMAKDNSGRSGWMNVVGTIYDYSDLHSTLLRRAREEAKSFTGETQGQWSVVCRTADNYDKEGVRTALWPVGCPISRLDEMRKEMGSASYNSQMNMNPLSDGQGLITPDKIVWVPRSELNNLRPRMREHVTIDLAGMENLKTSDTDFTAVVHAGFDTDGRLYILNVLHGRFMQHEIVEHIFNLYQDNPRIIDFKIQKDHLALGFLPTLQRERIKRQNFPLIVPIKIDNQNSKANRIRGLQPWFESGNIRIATDISCKSHLEDEIQYFPKFAHDDILDAIADQLQNRDGDVISDVNPSATVETERSYQIKNADGSMTLLGTPAQRLGERLWGGELEPQVYDSITGW